MGVIRRNYAVCRDQTADRYNIWSVSIIRFGGGGVKPEGGRAGEIFQGLRVQAIDFHRFRVIAGWLPPWMGTLKTTACGGSGQR